MAETAAVPHRDLHHIVWDWNGTLLADNAANLAAVNQVCAAFGLEAVTLPRWRSLFRRPLRACYAELLGRPVEADEWERVCDIYHEHYLHHLPASPLADGASAALAQWPSAGGTQSLLSMADHEHLVPLVRERGLAHHFTWIEGRRSPTRGDSKAEHLHQHLSAQGIGPRGAVVIGDIDDDARAAEEVGARAVLVANGLMTHRRLERTGHPVVGSISEAMRLIAG